MVLKELLPESAYWEPVEKDEKIEGTVEEIHEGKWGKEYLIQCSDGRKLRTKAHITLQERLKSVKPEDFIILKFCGTKKTPSGEMNLYKAWIDDKTEKVEVWKDRIR